MMKELKSLIISAKNGDSSAMMDIIKKFEPSVNSFVKQSRYSEDVRSELILTIIKTIRFFNFSNLKSDSERCLDIFMHV